MKDIEYGSAVILIILSSACIALTSFLGKHILITIALPAVMFLRFLFPSLLLWWVALLSGVSSFDKSQLLHNIIRASFGVLSQYALFYYLQYGSVLNATLLFMTSPLFIPLISFFLQKIKIHHIQWISMIIGFVGVACILKPGRNIIDWHALIGLMSGFFNAVSQVYFHKISRHVNASVATLSAYTFSTAISLLIFIVFYIVYHPTQTMLQLAFTQPNITMLFIGLAIFGISNKAFRSRAFQKVKAPSTITPFLYTAIIFSGLIDWIAYGRTPDYMSILGALLIVSSGILLYIKRKKPIYEDL